LLLQLHPNAIPLPLGNAEKRGDACVAGRCDKRATKPCRNARGIRVRAPPITAEAVKETMKA
jgi:hypothetical protein